MLYNKVIASITLRATMGRRRALLFAIPPIVLLVITVALKAGHAKSGSWPDEILGDFAFSVILPLTALIIGTSVLGAEIDDGSIIHLLATPVRRDSVIFTKFAVATGLTFLLVAVPEFFAGWIAAGGVGKFAVGLFVGAAVGSAIYNAIFVMLSVVTTRAIAAGLLYVLIWEGLLSTYVGGTRLLSVAQYSLRYADAFANDPGLHARLSMPVAVVMSVIVTGAALWFAVRRLSAFTVRGDVV